MAMQGFELRAPAICSSAAQVLSTQYSTTEPPSHISALGMEQLDQACAPTHGLAQVPIFNRLLFTIYELCFDR